MSNRVVTLLAEKGPLMELPKGRYALDAYGFLFRYLCSYRNERGDLFTKNGQVVSHLMGLSRLLPRLRAGRQIFLVFDGVAPASKKPEQERRRGVRDASARELAAMKRMTGIDADELRRLAVRTTRLEPQLLKSAIEFALTLGCHVVLSAGQAEPVMARLKREGIVDQLITDDSDIGLYQGVERYFRGISVTGPRVVGHCWNVAKGLYEQGLSRKQLVDAAILSGTDYWPGIRTVGPKTALRRVRERTALEPGDAEQVVLVRSIFSAEVGYKILTGELDLEKALELLEGIWSSAIELKRILQGLSQLAGPSTV